MGTRNLTCVVLNGEIKVAQYGQWDGYPRGQGRTVSRFIKHKMKKKLFKEMVARVKSLTQGQVNKRWKECGADDSGWAGSEVANKFKTNYPHLSRDTGAKILEMIQSGMVTEVYNSVDFAKDSLFCEWCYVIDLDNDTLEVYTGFNKKPLSKEERFYSEKLDDGGYYPIRLLKKYKFDELDLRKFARELERLSDVEEK